MQTRPFKYFTYFTDEFRNRILEGWGAVTTKEHLRHPIPTTAFLCENVTAAKGWPQ